MILNLYSYALYNRYKLKDKNLNNKIIVGINQLDLIILIIFFFIFIK